LKEGIGQVECEGGAIALLTNFEVVEQPTDIGKKQVVDLGLLLEGRLDLGKWVFQVPVLVGKGKCGPDLFEARSILPVSQEPIGLQGSRCSLGFKHRPLSPANFRQKTNQNQKATNPCPTFTNIKRLKWMNASTPAKKSTTRAFTQFMTA